MVAQETPPHKLIKFDSPLDLFPGREGYNAMVDKLNVIPSLSIGPLSARPVPASGLRFWVDEATGRLSVNMGTTWAGIAEIGGVTPGGVVVGTGDASEGSSARAARADHGHVLPLATVLTDGAMSKNDKALLDGATSVATSNRLLKANSNGDIAVNAPTSGSHPAHKTYVDTGLSGKSDTGHTHTVATITAAGFMSSADKRKLDIISTVGEWQSLNVSSSNFEIVTEKPPQYRVNNGRVEFRGILKQIGSAGGYPWTLPGEFRPKVSCASLLACSKSTGSMTESTVVPAYVTYAIGAPYLGSGTSGYYIFLNTVSWDI